MVTIDETTIAMAFAILGMVFSIVWIGLLLYGISSLRDLRDALREDDAPE